MTHKIRFGELQVSLTVATRRIRYRRHRFVERRVDRLSAMIVACGVLTVAGNLAMLVGA